MGTELVNYLAGDCEKFQVTMAATTTSENVAPHIALFPCAGMGHLLPFLRLAAMLDSRGCAVTIITVKPTVSAAESDHLSSFFTIYPHIKRLEFHLLPHKKSGLTNDDPFFIQMETIGGSVHLLRPLLSSLSPPLSAIVSDITLTAQVADLVSDLPISTYTLMTSSAAFFCLMAYLPKLLQSDVANCDAIEIPNLGSIRKSSIPPKMLDPNEFFSALIVSNVSSVHKVKGVIINTYTSFESEAIEAVRRNGIDHILPIGPFECYDAKKAHDLPWLDEQAPESVLFVSFGSRTALSKDQMRELGAALEKSGCTFLWVLKGGKVDKDDKEGVEDMLGASYLERTKKKGLIVKGWVNQEQILAHPAIGGFLSHCGWNSVFEAATLGVPVLAWPQHGDQSMNAEVVEKAGLGLGVREWGLDRIKLIDGDEIAEKLMELMQDEKLRERAREVRARARETREVDGDSEMLLQRIIDSLKIKED